MGHPRQVKELLRAEKDMIRKRSTPETQNIENGHEFCYDQPIIPENGSEEEWKKSWEDALKLIDSGQSPFHSE